MSLPEPLCLIPLDVAIVLRNVSLHEHNGSISYQEILQHSSMLSVMNGMNTLKTQSIEKALYFSSWRRVAAQVAALFSYLCRF